jgi:homogentisate 1,2-dioxygenase
MVDLQPHKLAGTMAFMLETRLPQHLTEYAARTAHPQDDYLDCWAGLQKRFDGTPGEKWADGRLHSRTWEPPTH